MSHRSLRRSLVLQPALRELLLRTALTVVGALSALAVQTLEARVVRRPLPPLVTVQCEAPR